MKTQFPFFYLLLLLCFLTTSCSSLHYYARVAFWNVPSPKDHKKFPKKIIKKADSPYHFTKGTKEQKQKIYKHLARVFQTNMVVDEVPIFKHFNNKHKNNEEDVDAFFKKMKTTAFLVITNDTIVFEKYYNKHSRESIQTSFSVAKSIVSLLVGKAIEEGKINSIKDPITNYLPELKECDKEFENITIEHLLIMKSGIKHKLVPSGLKAYYYPNLKKLALKKLSIDKDSKGAWNYNNYNTILLGLILDRVIDAPNLANYLERNIWSKIGTEANASWSTDKKSFEMMASGINARAIDFAKIGKLVLDQGYWDGQPLIEKKWIDTTTQTIISSWHTAAYHWYNSGMGCEEAMNCRKDFLALGIWGQIIYVSPSLNTIIVRQGYSKGKINEELSGGPWSNRIEVFVKDLHENAK